MNASDTPYRDPAIRAAASQWQVARDRGLSAAEAIEYEVWLAADPRHADAMRAMEGAWRRLDRIPEGVAQRVLADAARRRRIGRWRLFAGGAAALAATAAALLLVLQPDTADRSPAAASPASATVLQATGPRILTLADGTEVWLNAGSEIQERFTPGERRVRLARGEAYFSVRKDPSRPFLVEAGALRVRALGTAFNVNLRNAQSEVLVLEGRVAVKAERPGGAGEAAPAAPGPEAAVQAAGGGSAELTAGERATLVLPSDKADPASAAGDAPVLAVSKVGGGEIGRALAWQDDLLRLGGHTLAEIASEFGRRTGHRVVFAEPGLAQLRLGGRFRADDLQGFASLLATMLDVELEEPGNGTLVLRKKKVETP